jgi:hypothetical protein
MLDVVIDQLDRIKF